jgi:hypothetical protein
MMLLHCCCTVSLSSVQREGGQRQCPVITREPLCHNLWHPLALALNASGSTASSNNLTLKICPPAAATAHEQTRSTHHRQLLNQA